MSEDKRFDPAVVATVTVTFNSDIGLLRAQLDALPRESLKLVVDNASQAEALQSIRALVSRTPNARLLRNDENRGLAAAVNRGVYAMHDSPSMRVGATCIRLTGSRYVMAPGRLDVCTLRKPAPRPLDPSHGSARHISMASRSTEFAGISSIEEDHMWRGSTDAVVSGFCALESTKSLSPETAADA
ncbi:MAG: glycosyltransferase family 2 protein [Thiomonas delicata]